MSIEETIKKMLFERGMFEDQCNQVIARMKVNPAVEFFLIFGENLVPPTNH